MNIIDSHAHVICASPSYPRVAQPASKTFDAFDATMLRQAMSAAGVDKALLVQRRQVYGLDNNYVCDAAREDSVFSAVIAADCSDPRAGEIARNWHKKGAVGFRLMGLPFDSGLEWLVGPGADGLWQSAADCGVPMCVHFFASNRLSGLDAIAKFVNDYPTVPLVLDHLSGGMNGTEEVDGIDAPLRAILEHQQVVLKFTAIPLARLEAEDRAHAVISAYVSLVGAGRLMWGTDVTQSEGSYQDLVALGLRAVDRFTLDEQAMMLGGTVKAVYALDQRRSPVA